MVKQAFQTRGRLKPHTEWSQITLLLRAPCSSCFRGLCQRASKTVITVGSVFLAAVVRVPLKVFMKRYSIVFHMGTSNSTVRERELRGAQSYSSLSGTALKLNLISLWGSNKAPLSDLRYNLAWGPTLLRKEYMQSSTHHLVWMQSICQLKPHAPNTLVTQSHKIATEQISHKHYGEKRLTFIIPYLNIVSRECLNGTPAKT